MYVNTTNINYLSTTFYTTKVSTITFSEWQIKYNELLANYTSLKSEYDTLLNEYNELLANYTSLVTDYATLLSEYNELLADYNSRVAAYEALLNDYNRLSSDYSTLNTKYRSLSDDFNSLNSTYYSVQASYDNLKADYDELNNIRTELLTAINDLNQRIAASESELNIDRVVMFIFTIAVAALVVLIMYIKRKKQEPYVVIRKETVAIKPDEKPKIEPVS
jgi:predicted nuclease with TOPRIM domain